MSRVTRTDNAERFSLTGNDDYDARSIKISEGGKTARVMELVDQGAAGKQELVTHIRKIISELNDGFDFGRELAEEWARYLVMLVHGNGKNLVDPYSDLVNYDIETFSENTTNIREIDSIGMLEEMPAEPLRQTPPKELETVRKTLYVTALGGTDSSFYNGLSEGEKLGLARELYAPELYAKFEKYGVATIIPRGFASKKDTRGNHVTNAESTILQAYHAGIRHVAVIGNAKTRKAISEYLDDKLGRLQDLSIIVTAQPLLPIIRADHRSKELVISSQNGGYQGGHGHGFERCLKDPAVRRHIASNNLEYFVFGNGDNSVMLNWGASPFVRAINIVQELHQRSGLENPGIAFFLVWEYLRKGGFTFLLSHKQTGKRIVQIFEAELAQKCGADINSLRTNRGGYNTNVAAGIIQKAVKRFERLPMALKKKNGDGCTNFLFEASLGTALTTCQSHDGSSEFDGDAAIYILGPREARFQHWNHISIRKRDDLFAFVSSLFKITKIKTDFGDFPLIYTQRDAGRRYPELKGNFAQPGVLNTREFYEIFKDALVNVDEFGGSLKIDLLDAPGKARGKIKFEGQVTLAGEGELSVTVPAGELWIIKDKRIDVRQDSSVCRQDVVVEPM